jgi:hypothetical protein
MLSNILVALVLAGEIAFAQELAPTEQTSFSYPNNGAGSSIPFPSDLATLTGLSDWPELLVTPPFTPNMAKLFDPNGGSVQPDIVSPPSAIGIPPVNSF